MSTLKDATTATQCGEILAYLKKGKGLTQKESIEKIGSYRLASRIFDLKKKGHKISAVQENVQNRHGRFTLINRYFLSEFLPENAVIVQPKKSAAQARYDAAMAYYEENKGYEWCDYLDAFDQALKIAAGIK
jgi:hypothetical protein